MRKRLSFVSITIAVSLSILFYFRIDNIYLAFSNILVICLFLLSSYFSIIAKTSTKEDETASNVQLLLMLSIYWNQITTFIIVGEPRVSLFDFGLCVYVSSLIIRLGYVSFKTSGKGKN